MISDNRKTTRIPGIRYYRPEGDAVLTGLDGRLELPYGEIDLPLLEADFEALDGQGPTYDMVGRGIYLALRSDPDCLYGPEYARILKLGYPHYVSELASHIVMLDKKDVDTPYLDRKISYLKIFALMEPDNRELKREIGLALLEKGLSLPALKDTTVTLYRAETYLRAAVASMPDDVSGRFHLGEVCYLLGKYEDAADAWGRLVEHLPTDQKGVLERRLEGIAAGRTPRVPAADYLQAVAVAFEYHQQQEYEDAAAIIQDVLDDPVFTGEFPLAPVHYVLGLCCAELGMPRYAEDAFNNALALDPDHLEAREALANLYQ